MAIVMMDIIFGSVLMMEEIAVEKMLIPNIVLNVSVLLKV